MALNFPNSPALNDVYIDTTSGFSYKWNGTVWISFSAASSSQIKVLDDISGSFTGIAFTFALTSSSTSISPPNAQSLIINLGGVIQDASDDYIVSGSNIIFSTAPNNGLSFSGVSLGPAIPVNTIPDGTVTGGSFTVAGLLSTTNLFVSGISTFVGLATHTGTIFGSNLSLTGIATATEFDITGSSNTFNASGLNVGVATATTFVGNLTGNATGLSGTPNITVGTIASGNINSSGIATATTFVGALTGNATGLSGTPNITVNNVVASAGTFTNLMVNGTQTIINTTSLEISDKNIGIGSTSSPSNALADGAGITIYGTTNKTLTYNDTKKALETNIAWAPNETRIITGAEKIHRQSGNTVTLTYNSSSSSNVGYTTNPSGDITVNVVGIPTSSDFDDHSISFTVITNSTGTARTCTAVTLNGVSKTIRFAGGSLAASLSGVTTTTGHAIFSFTGINTIGSASTTANYELFGIVSGGFF